jgi:hypothetical protein
MGYFKDLQIEIVEDATRLIIKDTDFDAKFINDMIWDSIEDGVTHQEAIISAWEFATEYIASLKWTEKITGYGYDFLDERVWELVDDGEDIDEAIEFVCKVSMERDW